MYAAIVYAQPMFIPRVHNICPNIMLRIVHAYQCLILVHPLWCVIAFIQFGVDGRDKSAPTPTECTLLLFMYNQCLFHEHVIFTHVHQRAPTFTPRASTVGADLSCPHITEYTVWITVYNQCFTHVHPLWCVVAFIQFGVNGRDKSAPTPTECALRIVHAHQCLFHEHVIFTHVHQRLTHVHPL